MPPGGKKPRGRYFFQGYFLQEYFLQGHPPILMPDLGGCPANFLPLIF